MAILHYCILHHRVFPFRPNAFGHALDTAPSSLEFHLLCLSAILSSICPLECDISDLARKGTTALGMHLSSLRSCETYRPIGDPLSTCVFLSLAMEPNPN